MSKRGQEATSSEGSPMAKPMPMIPAIARPINLVSHSKWEDRKTLNIQIPGNRAAGRNLRAWLAQWNLCGSEHKDKVSEHEVHKPSIHDEDLPFCAKKVGNHRRLLNIGTWSTKDQYIDMGHVFVNESSHSSWTKQELRGNSEFIQYHTEINVGSFWRDSECAFDWKCTSLMDEIYVVSW